MDEERVTATGPETWRRNHYAGLLRAIDERAVLVVAATFLITLLGVLWHLSVLSTQLVHSTALNDAERQTHILAEFRSLYSSEVVARIAGSEVKVAHDYREQLCAIPLPATLTMELGRRVGMKEDGARVRLYSDYPFPWNTADGGPKDEFETDALAALRLRPSEPYYRFEPDEDGQPTLRFASADVMSRSCVDCHNYHPDSPKSDWQVGDVRGALSVTYPLADAVAGAESLLRSSFILLAAVAGLGLFAITALSEWARRPSSRFAEASGVDNDLGLPPGETPSARRKRRLGLGVLIGATIALVFSLDLLLPLGVAAGVPYVLPVLLSIWSRRNAATYAVALTGSLLTVAGFALSPPGGELWKVVANRILALFALWVTALLCIWQKRLVRNETRLLTDKLRSEADRQTIRKALHKAKEAQEVLRDREATIQAVVDAAAEGIIAFNEHGVIESCNEAALEMFGYVKEEVIGKNVTIFLPEESDESESPTEPRRLHGSISAAIGARMELEAVRKHNMPFPIEISVREVSLNDRLLYTALIRDLTEVNRLRIELAQAQKLESIGQLAAGIAHEINTPTQFVGDNTRFLQDAFSSVREALDQYARLLVQVESSQAHKDELISEVQVAVEAADIEYLQDEIPRAISQSLEGIDRIAAIVRAMKQFSHPGVTEKTLVDVNEAIETTMIVARNEWKYAAEMVMDLAPDLPEVMCMAGELNQVILNLIVNAAHAVAATIGESSEERGTITIHTCVSGDYVEMHVADTGTGIPEDIRDRVFDPFFTTKDPGKGTGQGLAVAHNVIVEKHGGTISVQSKVGQGTTFIVRLPLYKPHAQKGAELDEETHSVC